MNVTVYRTDTGALVGIYSISAGSVAPEPILAKPLTKRQCQIVELIIDGKFNKEIALIVGISQRTVENHRRTAMKKVGARTLCELVLFALTGSAQALTLTPTKVNEARPRIAVMNARPPFPRRYLNINTFKKASYKII